MERRQIIESKILILLVRIAKPMIAWHYYALMVADGLMADGMRRRRGMPRAGGMNGAHFRTLWAEGGGRNGGRADQGMKKSVVGIKPNGSCYFFSGERGRKKEREKKEKNPRLTNASDDRLALFPPPLPISV